jgi:hypothetical protein
MASCQRAPTHLGCMPAAAQSRCWHLPALVMCGAPRYLPEPAIVLLSCTGCDPHAMPGAKPDASLVCTSGTPLGACSLRAQVHLRMVKGLPLWLGSSACEALGLGLPRTDGGALLQLDCVAACGHARLSLRCLSDGRVQCCPHRWRVLCACDRYNDGVT